MLKRVAEDFSGLLALSGINERVGKLNITVNHPLAGNQIVEVTNNKDNLDRVKKSNWEQTVDDSFTPAACPVENTG